MDTLKSCVNNFIDSLKSRQSQVPRIDPEEILKKTLTKKELSHIKFNTFKKGTITCLVDSSAWLYHLSLRKNEMVAALQKESSEITDIRFYIGDTQCPRKNQSPKKN